MPRASSGECSPPPSGLRLRAGSLAVDRPDDEVGCRPASVLSGLRRALDGLAVAGLALGLAALALVTASDREDDSTSSIVLALTLGWGFAGAGIFAWWRRPDNRVGPLMALVGFTWFLGALTSADTAWAFTLGLLVGTLWLGALVHMLVAFPSGRVQPGLERRLVVLGWSATIALPLLAVLVTARPNDCRECPDNLLLVWDSERASSGVEGIGLVVSVVLLAGSAWCCCGAGAASARCSGARSRPSSGRGPLSSSSAWPACSRSRWGPTRSRRSSMPC